MDEVLFKRAENGWIIEFEGVTYISLGDHAEIQFIADANGTKWVIHASRADD